MDVSNDETDDPTATAHLLPIRFIPRVDPLSHSTIFYPRTHTSGVFLAELFNRYPTDTVPSIRIPREAFGKYRT